MKIPLHDSFKFFIICFKNRIRVTILSVYISYPLYALSWKSHDCCITLNSGHSRVLAPYKTLLPSGGLLQISLKDFVLLSRDFSHGSMTIVLSFLGCFAGLSPNLGFMCPTFGPLLSRKIIIRGHL